MPKQRRRSRPRTAAPLWLAGLALVLLALLLLGRRLADTAGLGEPAGAPIAPGPTAAVLVPTSRLALPTALPTSTALPRPTPSAPIPPAPAPTAAPTPAPAADDAEAQRAELLRLMNDLRAANGCGPLQPEERLTLAAQGHAEDLRASGRFEHTGSDGSTLSDRLARVGYAFGRAGENIVGGVASPAEAMALWTEGDENPDGPHRQNILNCIYTEAGVGLAYAGDGTPYWVLDLAVRR